MSEQDRLLSIIESKELSLRMTERIITILEEERAELRNRVGIAEERVRVLAKENKKLKTDLERFIIKMGDDEDEL